MLLKLITVSVLSIGLATSAMAQASGGSGGTEGSGGTSGSGTTGGSDTTGSTTGSGTSSSDKDKDSQGKQESSDCVQGQVKNAAGNCQ